MTEKMDHLKLAEELGTRLGGEMEQELKETTSKNKEAGFSVDEPAEPEVATQPEKQSVALAEEKEKPFTLEQIREAESAVKKITEGSLEIEDVPAELKQVVTDRLADERKAWLAEHDKDPIIRESKADDSPTEKLPEELELESRESRRQEKAEVPAERNEALMKEMLEKSAAKLAAARREMVAAMRGTEKADESVKKLSGWRKFFSQTANKKEKEEGAATDKKAREEELAKRKDEFKNALAVHRQNLIEDKKQRLDIKSEDAEEIKKMNIPSASADLIRGGDLELMAEYKKQSAVRIDKTTPYSKMTSEQQTASDFMAKHGADYERAKKDKELAIVRLAALPQVDREKAEELYSKMAAQKSLEGYAKEVINLTTSQEAIEIYNLKYQQEIDEKKELGDGQKWEKIKEKGLEAAQWYRQQSTKNKLLASAGLMAGGVLVGAAGGLVGGAALAGIFVGKFSQRALGAAGTGVGLEALIKRAQEAEARKDIEKKLDGKFLETLQQNLQENNEKLDDELFRVLGGKKIEERRRNLLAGTMAVIIGSGALAQAFSNVIPTEAKEWVAKKLGMVLPGIDQTHQTAGGATKGPGITDHKLGGAKVVELEKLAEIKKGDGIENVLIRQLKGLGLSSEQAGAEAHKIALNKGWVKFDPDGKMVETRVFFDPKNPAKYLLERDPSGKFNVIESGSAGKTYSWTASPETFSGGGKPEVVFGADALTSPGKIIEPGSDTFYGLQQEMESAPLSSDGRIPAINKMLEDTDGQLTAAEEHLKQVNLPSAENHFWQTQRFHLLEQRQRLTDGLAVKADQLPQSVKDLLPPEIISQDTYKEIVSSGKSSLSDLADSQKKVVNELYIKYMGRSFDEFNQLPEKLKGEYLDKLGRGMNRIVDSGVVSAGDVENLPHKALLWRNLGEMQHLQEIQGKFGEK